MRAKQDGNIIILELEGNLDFETTLQFREKCRDLIKKTNTQRVVFNMEKLKFVGSSGINQFIKILKECNTRKEKPKLCHVSSEFSKMFRAYQTTRNPFQIYDDEMIALQSFHIVEMKKPTRKRRRSN